MGILLKVWKITFFIVLSAIAVAIPIALTSIFVTRYNDELWQSKLDEIVAEKDKEIRSCELVTERLKGEIVGYIKVINTFSKTGKRRSLGTFEVTAYDRSGCVPFDDGVTSIGMPIGEGIFAVNPKIIPYGSILRIHGKDDEGNDISMYGIAGDTGGAMRQKPRLIDIFMPVNKDAKEFGRKKLNVELVSLSRR